MFEIVKDRPIPPRGYSPGRPPLYPFREMSIGDSFDVPKGLVSSVRKCAWRMAKILSCEFAVRQQQDGSAIVWRLK